MVVCVGFCQLLSGHLSNLGEIALEHQGFLFPDEPTDNPHEKITRIKRYPIALPMYPFRTLCPRELALQKLTPGEFDVASPLLPGNTQLNITLQRRKNVTNWRPYLLPKNLNVNSGSVAAQLEQGQWDTATRFTVPAPTKDDADAVVTYDVVSVAVVISDIYLEVNIITPPTPPPTPPSF